MRICIAGSRSFNDVDMVIEVFEFLESKGFIPPQSHWTFLSGMARGADRIGYELAIANEIPVMKFPADWDMHGGSAGYIRNAEMAVHTDVLVAFWDGESRGTKHMIETCTKKGIPVFDVDYDQREIRHIANGTTSTLEIK